MDKKILVKCKDCGIEWMKQKCTIKIWQGRCRSCAQKVELNKFERKEISRKCGKDVTARYGGVINARKFTSEISSQENNNNWKGGVSSTYRVKHAPVSRAEYCDICEKFVGNVGKNGTHLDHNHITGKFRGWLCRRCNLTLGALEDNTIILNKMINYINKNNLSSCLIEYTI
jgi:hypothetical protein